MLRESKSAVLWLRTIVIFEFFRLSFKLFSLLKSWLLLYDLEVLSTFFIEEGLFDKIKFSSVLSFELFKFLRFLEAELLLLILLVLFEKLFKIFLCLFFVSFIVWNDFFV